MQRSGSWAAISARVSISQNRSRPTWCWQPPSPERAIDRAGYEVESRADAPTGIELSDRERQILILVSRGLTDREIDGHLFIGTSTVRSHLDRMKTKTGLRRSS